MENVIDNVLEVRNIYKRFAGVQALDNISLDIKRSEIHCLSGENGSGKSTLIKILSGVYEPDEGEFIINGKTYNSISPVESMEQGIQVIYQDFSVFPNLSVAENIIVNHKLYGRKGLLNWKKIHTVAEEAINRISFQVDLNQRVGDLSVADRQLTAICRAIINESKLIIMDEPTSALTRKEVNSLFRVIRNLQEQGISILFVSHKMDEVFEISERFTIIRNGKNIITSETKELSNDKFVYYMTGRKFSEDKFKPQINLEMKPVVEVKKLGLNRAFTDVSFSVNGGEILGIAGLLGSGRRELALSLFGYYPNTSGQIFIKGKEIKLSNIQTALKYDIGHVPEDRLTEGLIFRQNIEDNIVISSIDSLLNRFGQILNRKKEERANDWIVKFGIATSNKKNKISTLSGGNQQKVVLSKWLARDPSVLILNGPTIGVDIGAKFDIHNILKDIAHEGMAIIIVSDDIPELLVTCNRILVMRSGKITDEIDPKNSSEDEIMGKMLGN